MEPARGEPRWLVLDEAHVPALGSEAGSFDHGGQDIRWMKAVAVPRFQPGRPRPIQLCGGFAYAEGSRPANRLAPFLTIRSASKLLTLARHSCSAWPIGLMPLSFHHFALAVEAYVRRRVIKTASPRVLNRTGSPETPIPVVV